MGEFKTDGIVLRYSNYRDYDKMISLLTPDYGLISVSARGVRKQNAKLRYAAELFTYGEYMLSEKNGRYVMTGCMPKDCFYPLREDIDRMCAASTMLEMTNYTATQQPQTELFQLLLGCLSLLSSSEIPPIAPLTVFLARLADISGYMPELGSCIFCGEKVEHFVSGEGGMCDSCFNNNITKGWEISKSVRINDEIVDFIYGCVQSENESFLYEINGEVLYDAYVILLKHIQECFDFQFKSACYFI